MCAIYDVNKWWHARSACLTNIACCFQFVRANSNYLTRCWHVAWTDDLDWYSCIIRIKLVCASLDLNITSTRTCNKWLCYNAKTRLFSLACSRLISMPLLCLHYLLCTCYVYTFEVIRWANWSSLATKRTVSSEKELLKDCSHSHSTRGKHKGKKWWVGGLVQKL